MSRAPSSRFIPTLDGWRAVAIGFVLCDHGTAAIDELHIPALSKVVHLVGHGSVGVDIFFAISGYLICTLLLREKRQLEGRIDLGRFYLRRAFRILPAMLAYLGVVVALRAVGQLPSVTVPEIWAVLGFFRNYSGGSWYTSQFWSLAIEEHFYLVMPLLLAALRWRMALVIAASLSVASMAWRWFEFRYAVVQPLFPDSVIWFRTENRFDGLMNGAILALLLDHPAIRERFRKWLSLSGLVAVLAATAVVLGVFPSLPTIRTVSALVIPIVIASTVLRPDSLAGRFLDLAPLRLVGRLSFSLYVWQELFLLWDYVELAPNPLGQFQRNPGSFLPVLACAVFSYYAIERPMLRLGHHLAGSPATTDIPHSETDAADVRRDDLASQPTVTSRRRLRPPGLDRDPQTT